MKTRLIYFDENTENHDCFNTILKNDFEVSLFSDREKLLKTLSLNNRVDIILIDNHFESGNFFEFLKDIEVTVDRSVVGIVLISSENKVLNRIKAFEFGVDDFLIKPITTAEIIVRLLNKANKHKVSKNNLVKYGNLLIDFSKQRATIGSKLISLTPIEFKILTALVKKPNRIHSKEELCNLFWKDEEKRKCHSIDTHICNLRRKISNFNYSIKASKGKGVSLLKKDMRTNFQSI
ncbi:hypothetical protein A9Q84_08370 [Halobacteriovorax marinus]|uniref:Uncharacterized protein n=1 Tax=Halobacteriovorax marinus TaxID=97084 RepID=A0A1Y5FBX4_9BACT|nr:hypothetical protein A9Q84_08370 [Halobacteriovorax marinus]